MNDDTGYIKIHRSFLSWEWHDQETVVSVFLHCLLLANWETKKWHGLTIERGSFITSTVKLSESTGLTRQTVSKCLKRLQSTGELQVESNRNYTKVTVVNYDKYQSEKSQVVNEVVKGVVNEVVNKAVNEINNDVNNEVNTTKNIKNYKNKEVIDIVEYLNLKAGTNYRPNSEKTKKLVSARLKEGYTVDDFKTVIDKKVNEWSNSDMAKYLRPETLFGTKFEAYLNQKQSNGLPQWYNAEPLRVIDETPATAEEVEKARELLTKGVNDKSWLPF